MPRKPASCTSNTTRIITPPPDQNRAAAPVLVHRARTGAANHRSACWAERNRHVPPKICSDRAPRTIAANRASAPTDPLSCPVILSSLSDSRSAIIASSTPSRAFVSTSVPAPFRAATDIERRVDRLFDDIPPRQYRQIMLERRDINEPHVVIAVTRGRPPGPAPGFHREQDLDRILPLDRVQFRRDTKTNLVANRRIDDSAHGFLRGPDPNRISRASVRHPRNNVARVSMNSSTAATKPSASASPISRLSAIMPRRAR